MTSPVLINVIKAETLAVRQESDVILLTNHIRQQALRIGMSALSQTKLSTAASELARNILVHGGGGNVLVEQIRRGNTNGMRLVFTDRGPGIENIDLAMQTGYSSGTGMGLGLPGAKQLADDFYLESKVTEGTTVTILKWAND